MVVKVQVIDGNARFEHGSVLPQTRYKSYDKGYVLDSE